MKSMRTERGAGMKMKHFAVLAVILSAVLAGGCSGSGSTTAPGNALLVLTVTPNPILAHRVSGDVYDFPFTVTIKEQGGQRVDVRRVSADVYAFSTLNIYSESYDSAEIAARGYATQVPANGQVSYQFAPRKEVSDDRLFSSVSADLKVEGVDENGVAVTARTRVTVRRG